MEHQDLFKKHSDFIWEIANLLRGPYRPPQYRRVMIPLTVLRRLDCVLEASKDKVLAEYKLLKTTDKFSDELIEKMRLESETRTCPCTGRCGKSAMKAKDRSDRYSLHCQRKATVRRP